MANSTLKLKDVKKYVLFNHNLYVQKKSNDICDRLNNKIDEGTDLDNLKDYLVWNKGNSVLLFDSKTNTTATYLNQNFIQKSKNDNLIYTISCHNEKSLCLINFKEGVLKEIETHYNWEFIFEAGSENVLLFNEDFIKLKSTNNYETKWITSLNNYGKIKKILSASGDFIWVSLLGKDLHKLIALDIKNGTVIKTTDNIKYFDSSHCFLHENTNSIICLNSNLNSTNFVQLDSTTGDLIRAKELKDLEEGGFTLAFSKNFTIHGDWIYLTVAKINTLFGCGIAKVSLKTLNTNWISLIEGSNGTISQAALIDNSKLYILDNGGTLHVFDDE